MNHSSLTSALLFIIGSTSATHATQSTKEAFHYTSSSPSVCGNIQYSTLSYHKSSIDHTTNDQATKLETWSHKSDEDDSKDDEKTKEPSVQSYTYPISSYQANLQLPKRSEILIPANGKCLYSSIIVAYLLDASSDEEFKNYCQNLFGTPIPDALSFSTFKQQIKDLEFLRSNSYQKLIITFAGRMSIDHTLWGGALEIQKIADKLNVNIQEYTPNPDNLCQLVTLFYTKPKAKSSPTILHIVLDNPLPKEAVNPKKDSGTQIAQYQSVQMVEHPQHYRVLTPSSQNQSQPLPSLHSIDSKPFPSSFKQHNHSKGTIIGKLPNDACELIPHFIKNQKRLLWKGTTFVRHKNLSQKVYCLLTNDDKLYLFSDKNNLKKPLRLIDLSQYSFVAPVSKASHLFILSSVNPYTQKTTPYNTVEFEHKDHPDILRHLLRCATHKYYYYDSKQDALKLLHKNNIIDESHYLIQFICQVSKDDSQNTHMYCLFSTNFTYQQLCGLFERYLNTNVERLTRYGEETDLTQNQSPTYWECSTEERVYSITFSPQINYAPFPKSKLVKVKESTCPYLSPSSPSTNSLAKTCKIYEKMMKKDPFAQENIDEEKISKVFFTKKEYNHLKTFTHGHKPPCIHKEKCRVFRSIENREQQKYDCANNEYIHTLLFYHPRKRHIEISVPKRNPFIYQKDFASMHSLDMRKENPLRQLEDPRGLLKQLLLEVIQNEAIEELVQDSKEDSNVPILLDSDDEDEDSDDERMESIEEIKNKIESVKYPTSHELPWLKEAEEKMQCEQHKKLGSPLNIAEMCAIVMYTNTNCYIDLGKAQLNGEFEKWAIWDQLLIRAILKLHREEKKINQFLYCGMASVDVKVNGQKGFFKTYISTSKNRETGMIFSSNSGMLIHLSPEMQIQFPNCNISWISGIPDEEEILFARSADVGIFPAAQWQAFTFKPKNIDNKPIQHIRFRPVAQPLMVRKGKTLELPAAPFHTFSDIKLEEGAIVTVQAWQPTNEQGGRLYLHCLGDCILEKNAKIDVSEKGYAGGTKEHPQGYGPGGGHGGKYCAAGGSHITQGSAAQCEDGFGKALYGFSFYFHARPDKTYGKPMYAAKDLSLGSGGGSIQYSNGEKESGSPGGGALYLKVSGDLHIGKNTQLLANGGNAHSLNGGAGSGGSLFVQVKGKLICPNSNETHFAARGGSNERACHPLAQGSGGNGNITLHVNQLHIIHDASHEKIIAYWCRQHTIDNTKLIIKNLFIITAFLLHYNSLPTAVAAPQTSIHNEAPHHVTITGHYYNAKGEDYRKKAQYSEALAYHKKALQLQEEKYGNKAVHPVIAETYGYKGETLAAQGNYRSAIVAHQEELRIAQACYQKTNAAHPKLLEAYTHLSIAHHGQGEDTEAMEYLKKAIQVSEEADDNKEIADVYDARGLLHRSQANYNQAMQDHQKAANIRKKLYNQKAHSDRVTSYKHIGQIYHAQGKSTAAIAAYQDGIKMWQKLCPNQPHHPDGAAIDVLIGDAYHSLGQYKQAITYQEKALTSYNKTYAKQNHPDIADTLLRLGQSYSSQGDYDFATYHYQKAIQMLRALYKQKDTLDEPFHPAIADALEQQGNAYLHFGNATKALKNHKKAEAIRKLAYSDPSHPKRIASCNSIARFHLHQKQYEQALQTVKKGIQIWEQHGTQAAHPITALAYRLCGLVYYNQTQYASARKEHQMSLSIHTKLYGDKPHPAIADDHHAIADTYAKEGKYKDHALPYYKKALEIRQKIYQNTPYHPAIAAALTAIGTTYAKIGHSDQAITNHVKATRCQSQHFCKENQIDHTLNLYVPTNASRAKALEEEVFPLHPRVQQFIDRSDNTVLLLHGDAGVGKSLYGRFLENKLWSNYQENNQSVIPLLISLPALKDPIHHAITETLMRYGWDNATIQALQKQSYHHYTHYQKKKKTTKKDILTDKLRKSPQFDETAIEEFQKWLNHHDMDTDAIEEDIKNGDGDSNICDYKQATNPQIYQKIKDFFNTQKEKKNDTPSTTPRLLIFLDGYNEINATQNLYQTNQLAQWGAKVIIGCRTEYLNQLDDYRQYLQADAELYIRPFNSQQIDTYLDRIDTTKQPNATQTTTWRKAQYKAKFEGMPALQTLSTSPFLLQLIVTALPHLPNRTQITRADIYKTFIEEWIKNAVNRMEQQGMGAIELEKCWEYARKVGLFMFLHERVTIQASTTSLKETGLCNHFSNDEKECHYTGVPFLEEAHILLRKALPLKQLSNTTSSFLHQSIQEYCAAQALLQSVAQLSPRSPSKLTTYFTKKVKTYNPITNQSTPALNQKLLNAAPSIIHFLGDELASTAQYPAWKKSLFAIIEASKKNPQVAIAAANSATILNAGGILLHDKDWAGIAIPHALLDHAFLARTNLQGANLRHVSLRQAYLENAQLQKADLYHIHFGEHPTLYHPDEVMSVSWSPDGKYVASSSWKSVHIWGVATGKLLQQCTGHTCSVKSVSWSLDGTRLASASQDKSVHIWEVATGKLLQQCTGHTHWVNSVSWSPDGTRIASASKDKSVRIWEVATGKQLQQYTGHTDIVSSVSWSPDSTRLASASDDKSVRIWEVATGKQLQQYDGHTNIVSSVSWSPDGKRLASASEDKSVRIWNVVNGKEIQKCEYDDEVSNVSWSPDSTRLASVGGDYSVRIWDVESGKEIQQCTGHRDVATSVSWSPDGQHVASASLDNSVRIWEVAKNKAIQTGKGHKKHVISVSYSPKKNYLASASLDNSVRIWNLTNGKEAQKCIGHTKCVTSVSWSSDGTHLASASKDRSVRIWDVATGNQLPQSTDHKSTVWSVSWSPDGTRLASANDDNSVHIWDAASGKQLRLCTGHSDAVASVSWSPNGTRLASASDDNSVCIWDVATGKQLQRCGWSPNGTRRDLGGMGKGRSFGRTNSVYSVRWSPDGKRLASASSDNNVHIWDAATGNLLLECTGHTSSVKSVRWSPDGTRLASASDDKSVRIWDAATGKPLLQCTGHNDSVRNVSWSLDGKHVASASQDNSVRIWEVTTSNSLKKTSDVKQGKVVRIITNSPFLTLTDANFTGAIGLSEVYKLLVQQRKGYLYLIQKCTGHSDSVRSVSWSPHGQRLASASKDKSVRIWEVASGELLQQYIGHTDTVSSISWSPDEKCLASASEDNSVRIWDVANGKQLRQCTGHTHWVKSISWSPNGTHLASASDDKNVRIWDAASGKLLQQWSHTSKVNSVSWSPNGTHLASASNDKSVRIWRVATGEEIQQCTGHISEVNSVSWSPDGTRVASASNDNSVRIWEVATGNQLQKCIGHTDWIHSVSWSPNGIRLASASNDKSVRIWDVATGNQLQQYTSHACAVTSISWSPDGKHLASGSGDFYGDNSDNSVQIWEVKTPTLPIEQLYKELLLDNMIDNTVVHKFHTWLFDNEMDTDALYWDCQDAPYSNLDSHNATIYNRIVYQWLIKQQWNTTEINIRFFFAAEEGQLRVLQLLKQKGANPLANDKDGNNALHLACLFSGSIETVKWLLDVCHIPINTKGQYQKTPFLCAANQGQLEIAKLLRKRGANIHAKDKYGHNALHFACLKSGSVPMVTWLLDECKISLETKANARKTTFLCAAEKGQLEIAKLLRKRGANIHAKDKYGHNALHFACLKSGSVPMVTWLLDECKISLETKANARKTTFLYAAQKGKLPIAKLLKERGADINAQDAYGNNALHLACLESDSVEIVTWLLDVCQIGLETKAFNQQTPFLCAVNKGQLGIAKLLKERGANLNAKDKDGNNALHNACYSGSVEMITWLIETKEEYPSHPFLFAAKNGELAIAKLLKEHGANIHAKDKDGDNALHYACLSGSVPMATWLLDECKIDMEVEGGYEQGTPFLFAANNGQMEIAKLLKERGANVNVKDKDGDNALHAACLYSGSVAMVDWLLDECKMGLETKGQYQNTPFLCAAKKGQLAIAKLLKERGANIHAKDEYGNNALHLACLSGSVEMTNWLLDECKIDMEAEEGEDERTPFLCAVNNGQLAIAELLKERGANIHAKDAYGNSALHMVCLESDSVEMVTWLLDVCKIDIETKGGFYEIMPFLCAAAKGQLAIANLLRQRGANINAKDEDGNNALHLACLFSGSADMVTWLLDVCKIDMEAEDYDERTPFLFAAKKGQMEIAKLLRERGANIHAKDKDGNNALHLACLESDSVKIVTWLLDECKIDMEAEDYDERTPFLCAVLKGKLAIANLLRQRGANIHAKDKYGSNALHAACLKSGSVDMVTWLLDECKIDMEAEDYDERTPFLFAAKKGQMEIAKLLKERGANVNVKDKDGNNALDLVFSSYSSNVDMITWLLDVCHIDIETKYGYYQRTPFLCAVNNGQMEIAKLLKEHGADIDAQDAYGYNALHAACFSDSAPIARWLLDECKIDMEAEDYDERTPFLCAVNNGQMEIAKLLKERGANVNVKDKDGNNALDLVFSSYSSNVDMITWLLDVCHIDIETKYGYYQRTPFLCAVNNGQMEIAKLLKEHGADIDAQDAYGYNALHAACFSDSAPIARWLLDECKIDMEAEDYDERTPFLFAAKKGQMEIAKLLKEHGTNIHAKDKDGNNALHLACLSDSVPMATWLLDECKIDMEAKDGYERTPFLCAVNNGQMEIAKLLKERGANVNVKDKDGNNALDLVFSSYSSNVDMITWLLDVCHIDIETKYGYYQRTPFLFAAKKGQMEIAKLLRERGANIHAKDKDGNNALHMACLESDSVKIVTWLLDECKIDMEAEDYDERTPFLFAAKKGQIEIAKLLRERGANIHAKDKDGNNALHLACLESDSVKIVTWLLDECKIDIEAKDGYERTPFLCAAEGVQVEIAKRLKEHGADINAKDGYGNNALHLACLSDSVPMATWLLDECKIDMEAEDYDERTPFLFAAKKGQMEIAKLLRERGANIHAKDKDGNNALHLACLESDSVKIVTWLLDECKIDMEAKDGYERTPFLCAAEGVQVEIAKRLKEHGADINAKDGYGNNALHLACLSDSVPMATWLLDECKIDMEAEDYDERTPFLFAAKKGQMEIAKLLRERGANIHAKDKDGNNALHLACLESDSVKIVTWLLDECKIDMEAEDYDERTPFLFAAKKGQMEIAKLLKEHGTNIHAKDKDGNNALHLACLSDSVPMATWLLDECKIDMEAEDYDERTPFLFAAKKGQMEIAKLLRERGANIHAKDKDGNNALHLACLSGNIEMIPWLLDVCHIDIEAKGQYQITPFICATEKGRIKIAKLLRLRGANIHAKNEYGNNALHLACLSGNIEMIPWLLDVCTISIEVKGQYQITPFLCAAEKGRLEIAKRLKERGANLNAKDKYGNNALHFACDSGSVEMITWLIETRGEYPRHPFLFAAKNGELAIAKLLKERGANIHAKDGYGNNALHLACLWSGSESMITWLLDACKISIEAKGQYQRTPFLCAAEKGQLEIAKRLKERGANIHAKDKDGNNALHLACLWSGSESMVTWLLDVCHIDIETKGYGQKTPFLSAAAKGQLAIAKLLKEQGADIDAEDKYGKNALHYACLYSGSVDMVNWLLDVCHIGLETKGRYQKTPFLCAVNKGQLGIAKRLKERGANIHATDESGDSALHQACLSGSVDMVTWLLDVCKIGLETKGYGQMTPFLCAENKGQLEIAKLLKEHGADVNAEDAYGNNALHVACLESDSVEIVTWLLDVCKIDLETKGHAQQTPFLCAARKGELKVAKLLKERGANLNAKDKNGNNALHNACYSGSVEMITWLIETKEKYPSHPFLYAAKNGEVEIAKLLKERGANINARDKDGDNALHLACLSGSVEMVTWLLDVCKISLETKGYRERTSFLCAANNGQMEIAKLLKQHGADIDAQDGYGNNALHLACLSDSVPMATWLLDECKIDMEVEKGDEQITPFLYAAEKGQLAIAKLLKEHGADIDAQDGYGNNALHLACLSDSVPMATWLLDECKIDKEEKDENEMTPFLCAAYGGQLAIAKLLKEHGANINAKDGYGYNALHFACHESDSVEIVTWLLDECKIDMEAEDGYERTPFLCAAEGVQVEIAKRLKEHGADINAKDGYGNNALHAACLSGNIEMIPWLLDVCHIDIEAKGQYQITPFICATEKGRIKIAKLLRLRGANIHAKNEYGNNALHLACLSGNIEMIPWLLDVCTISIEVKGQYQITPFLCAAEKGRLEIAKRLKEHGADINAKDGYGYNALHLACLSGNIEMIPWLLDVCHIDIEAKGQYQITPFICATEKGRIKIAKLLRLRGANIHAKNEYGNNALHLACLSGNIEMIPWLLDVCTISIEVKGQYQITPFLCAAEKGRLEIAKRLKERGANLNAKDKYGNNALHFACDSGSVEMITWLIETRGEYPRHPFLFAAKNGELAIAKLLKERGANIHAKDGYGNNALHLACLWSGSESMVTWLLDACKISIEAKGQYQRTPFLCAAEKGQLEIAKRLKERGANIHAKDKDGNNALHLACLWSGSESMVTWMLDVCHIDIETKGYGQKTPFLSAAAKGQLAIAKLLKEQGADIDAEDKYGKNALHYACLYSGSVDMVNWLLDICHIGLETKGRYQKTPFLCAVNKGQLGIAKRLKERGANIHATDESGDSALHQACLSGSVDMVTWLLDVCKIGLETKGYRQMTPFLCAENKGQLEIAKLLKEHGADVNAEDAYGNNALHVACLESDSVEIVTWLLDVCKIDLETKGHAQQTPFLCAARKGELKVAKLLNERGANLNAKDKNGNNALHNACYSGSVEMITWLIETKEKYPSHPFLYAAKNGEVEIAKLLKERGANINARDKDGDNALHLACLSGSVEMVTWLLDVCKISLETKGYRERTPFLYAAEKGQLAIAKLLKEHGADIDAQDEYGNNALHLACLSDSVPMATWLLDECKIDMEAEDYDERTPFLCAAEKGQLAIAKLLKEHGANINAKDGYGYNALHFACHESDSVEIVTWLLDECKIDMEAEEDVEQRTPFLYAVNNGQLAIAKLLKEQGANIHARDKDGDNALHQACYYSGSVDMVTWLLDECKIDMEVEKGYEQRTPFLCAVNNGQLEIAKRLKERGANIHATDIGGNNALHAACFLGSVEMITWFLDVCHIGLETKGFFGKTPFLCAVNNGQLAIAKRLNERGANLNAKDKDGNNALHNACYSGSVEMTTWLLDVCHMDIETKGQYQRSPFLCAAKKGQLAIAKLLKERGANIHAKDEYGDSALHQACLSGSVDMVTWLLDVCKIGLETKGYRQMTPFLCAENKGQLEIAKLLKEHGADVNAEDAYGNNALHVACLESDSVEIVTWLLDVCQIGLETKGFFGKTPFLCAVNNGQLAIAKRLKERGANIHAKDKDGNNALHFACDSGSVEMITWLIETRGEYPRHPFLFAAKNGELAIAKRLKQQGTNINETDVYRNNALHTACLFSGNVDMTRWLLGMCHMGLETKGDGQKMPFLWAASRGQLKIAKRLKQQGANINAKDAYEYNALHTACLFSGNVDMTTWLLDVCHMGIETKGYGQKMPFLWVASRGQLKIAKRLKQQGANINEIDAYGNSALYYACAQSGSPSMTIWLLYVCKIGIQAKGGYEKTSFLCVVKEGHVAIAKLLRKKGTNINAEDEYGNNTLHAACYSGSVEMTNWLLDMCHIGLETKGDAQKTSFLWAASRGQLKIAKRLKQQGTNINETDVYRNNALHTACLFSGNVDMTNWLLDMCHIGLETKGYGQKMPFLWAASRGQLKIAKRLKQQGANINAKDAYGYNALHTACLFSGNVDMTTWLLDMCHIGLETKGYGQKMPFLWAASRGQLKIAKRLKQKGANINETDAYGNNALHTACLSGSVDMVTWLLDVCNIGLETKGYGQKMPFLWAASRGQLKIAKRLKQQGANINAKDAYGYNALHTACLFSGNVDMTTWLLDMCHIGLETKGYGQKMPFLWAASRGQLKIAKRLKQKGANINETDAYGNNALHTACLSGSVDMVTWLLDVCNIGLETKGQSQGTPFLCAAYKGQLEIAKLLKERGANINAKDRWNRNALKLAKQYGRKEMTCYLQSLGLRMN